MSELLCTELSAIPAISTRLHDDQRRLGTYLEQEERFMPSTYHMQKTVEEEQRQRMLEIIYEVSFAVSVCVILKCVHQRGWSARLHVCRV